MQPFIQLSRDRSDGLEQETHVDPVCKMLVHANTAAATFDYHGTTYYFCAVGCRERFAADPNRFLSEPGAVATGLPDLAKDIHG